MCSRFGYSHSYYGNSRLTAKAPIPSAGIAGALFTPVQQRLLGLLFGQPERQFQSAELIRLVASGTGGVHRVLLRLAGAGLVCTERVGNQKFYRANTASPVYSELRGLIVKTSGLVLPLAKALNPLRDRIRAAFVYGSVAKGSDTAASDIDLMIIGDGLNYVDAFVALQSVERELARPVNANVINLDDWAIKRRQPGFISRVSAQPRIIVIGSEQEVV